MNTEDIRKSCDPDLAASWQLSNEQSDLHKTLQ